MFVDTVLYYVFFSSSLLLYGIGINRVTQIGFSSKTEVTFYVKLILSIFCSSVLSWLVTYYILLPLGIIELFPIFTFLIYVCINAFFEALIRITTNKSCSEFVLSFSIVLISILESSSLLNSLLICLCCLCAIIVIVPLIIAFKSKVCPEIKVINEKYYALFFIFLAVIIIIFSVADVSWINFLEC